MLKKIFGRRASFAYFSLRKRKVRLPVGEKIRIRIKTIKNKLALIGKILNIGAYNLDVTITLQDDTRNINSYT